MKSRRIRLIVRYDGTDFAGSQIQPGERTVAGTLKTELESLLDEEVHLLFAGRTDAGVHADCNVCVFDARPAFPVERLPLLLNPRLPSDLEARAAAVVDPEFHPRYDAIRRTYLYRLYLTRDIPVDRRRCAAPYDGPWEDRLLPAAIDVLVGDHSFATFSRGVNAEDARCKLESVVTDTAFPAFSLRFTADRFLRHMVRLLVGTLIDVAAGKVRVQQLKQALEGQLDFQLRLAPPNGLTLVNVEYPPEEQL